MNITDFETIFFGLNFYFVTSQIEEAKKYLEILREEQEEIPSLFYQMDQRYQERLIKIAHLLDSNIINNRLESTGEDRKYNNIEVECDEEVTEEKEIVKKLCKSNVFHRHLGDNFELLNLEHPTEYGKVDILGQSGEIIYPIEVKLKRGTHSIIGQIEKYMKHFWKKLGLKLWKDVNGIIIAKSYERYVLEELNKLNVVAFTYYIKNKKIDLIKI